MMETAFLLISIIAFTTKGETIYCDAKGSVCTCDSFITGETCYLDCAREDACQDACVIDCTGEDGCGGNAKIMGSEATELTIICGDEASCKGCGGISVIITGLCIFVPILSYFWYQFNSYVIHTEIVKHHNKKIIQYMNILCIISLTLERPFVILSHILKEQIINPPTWIIYTADSITIWSIFVLFTIKSWLLYYNFQYHMSLTKLIWKKEINKRYRSWYIQHKNTYGNVDYLICIITIPFLIYIALESFIECFLLQNVFIHSMGILTLIIIIPSFILYKKLKIGLFTDIYGIKNEIIYQQRTICILILVIICNLTGRIILYHKHQNTPNLNRVLYLFDTTCASIVSFSMAFISIWNPYQLQLIQSVKNLQYLRQTVTDSSSGVSGPHTDHHVVGIKDMLQCISDHNGFLDFMKHLVREFATENLLFLCEYTQIKYELQTLNKGLIKIPKAKHFNHDIHDNVDESDKFITIDFNAYKMHNSSLQSATSRKSIFLNTIPQLNHVSSIRTSDNVVSCLFTSTGVISTMVILPAGLPKSEIINESKDFIGRLYKLYLKYIKTGSIHEVNISHVQRQSLNNIFCRVQEIIECKDNEIDKHELESSMFTVFDEACWELLLLMSHSYIRFDKVNKEPKALEVVDCIQVRNGRSYSQLKKTYQIQ
eukprot:11186_1